MCHTNTDTVIAKVVVGDYPHLLHKELANAGVTVPLTAPMAQFLGNVQLLEMQYLRPVDGWIALSHFDGDWDTVTQLCEDALDRLHQCLDSSAVHGDLRPPNIMVR